MGVLVGVSPLVTVPVRVADPVVVAVAAADLEGVPEPVTVGVTSAVPVPVCVADPVSVRLTVPVPEEDRVAAAVTDAVTDPDTEGVPV